MTVIIGSKFHGIYGSGCIVLHHEQPRDVFFFYDMGSMEDLTNVSEVIALSWGKGGMAGLTLV